nr:cation:proton antiporter [Kibdelosporangium sp. MJ126-NF4]
MLIYAAAGAAMLAAALLPRLLGKAPFSMPMVFLAVGAVSFGTIGALPDPDPVRYATVTQHLTELCVIISLMGAGLALNRPVGLRRWATTWRLLAIAMPLSMIAVGLLGWAVLGVGLAAAVLLAAVLAPTDPVLATEVQVAEPADDENDDDETRHTLTAEAGLNDGLAFPFVYAAVALAAAQAGWVWDWLVVDVLWRLTVGVVCGLLIGWLLGKLFFSVPSTKVRLAEHAEGFVGLAATFLTFGLAELAEGYGFVAVFVCGCTIRAAERSHGYHRVLHQYIEQTERMVTVLIIFLLGGAAATGLLAGLTWREILVAAAVLLVVRPLAGLAALVGRGTGLRERAVISFFGVRGVGSLFYLTYALQAGEFGDPRTLWRIVAVVVIGSIVLHGVTASPSMRILDRSRALRNGSDPVDHGRGRLVCDVSDDDNLTAQ